MSRLASIALIALFSLAGCFGTETGNPPFAPSVSGDTGVPMGIAPQLSVQEAWLSIANVAFEPAESCGIGEGVVVRSEPAALALSGAQALEAAPVLDEGDYCAFRFERVVWTASAPAALQGSTLAIDATLSDGTAVRIRSARAGAIRLLGEPFAMSEEAGALLVFIDESLLFNGLSFDAAAREPDGSILVDADTNSTLLDRIEAQLAGAVFLYRDVDADGVLSSEERAADALATAVP